MTKLCLTEIMTKLCLTEICAFKICFQFFSATHPNQYVPQTTFNLIITKIRFFYANIMNLFKKFPNPVLLCDYRFSKANI